MENSRLPIEICENVIDNCLTLGPGVLYVCSLTCRAWVPRTRVWLYEIRYIQSREDSNRLTQSFRAQPRNGTFLFKLIVVGIAAESTSWINTVFTTLPPLIPNVNELKIVEFSFLDVHQNFLRTLDRLKSVKTLSMTRCRFSTFHQIARFLFSFPQVTDLSIWYSSFRECGRLKRDVGQPRRAEKISLSSLSLGSGGGALSSEMFVELVHFFRLTSTPSTLSTLNLRFSTGSAQLVRAKEAVDEFLTECGSTLRTLRLDFTHNSAETPQGAIDLSQNDQITQLTLVSSYVSHITAILSTVSSKSIETISIFVPYTLKFASDDNSLSDLDDAFDGPAFKHLGSVFIDVPPRERGSLPKLDKWGILSVRRETEARRKLFLNKIVVSSDDEEYDCLDDIDEEVEKIADAD